MPAVVAEPVAAEEGPWLEDERDNAEEEDNEAGAGATAALASPRPAEGVKPELPVFEAWGAAADCAWCSDVLAAATGTSCRAPAGAGLVEAV